MFINSKLNKHPAKNLLLVDKPDLKIPFLPGIVFLTVLITGVIGYNIIWKDINASFVDCLYMTVITVTTLGYLEVHPLNDGGRIFTMIISVAGIGSLFYLFGVIMEDLFIIQLSNYRGKKKMLKKLENMKNHIIVVGYGKVGKLASSVLETSGEQFIVIDEEFKENIEISESGNIIKLKGNAAEDEILMTAQIQNARGLIITTPDSSVSVFVVLSAKVLNPDIFIVARAEDESVAEKLRRAGASRTVNPYTIGGQRLANLMINQNVVDFLETGFGSADNNLNIESINLPDSCNFYGKTLREIQVRQKTGVSIIAVIRNQEPFLNPDGNFIIMKNDQIVILGTRNQLKNFETLAL